MRDRTNWDQFVAPIMFFLSLEFLALLAAILVLWIDVDRVVDPTQMSLGEGDFERIAKLRLSAREVAFEEAAHRAGNFCAILLLLIWPLFWAEQIVNFLRLKPNESYRAQYPYGLVYCFIPPLRLCASRRGEVDEIWFPHLGWQTVDRKLRRSLERTFSIPMIWIALMILPVLAIHFVFQERIVNYPWLRIVLHFGTGMIWFAFTVEFVVMVSVAEKKWRYCKEHWLDLAIILLPLISFLRSLRILRASKLLKAGKLTQLTKVVRVYRLRGVAMRGLRAFMVLEVLHRLFRISPEKRIQALEELYLEKQHELLEIQEQIDTLKRDLNERNANERNANEREKLDRSIDEPDNVAQSKRETPLPQTSSDDANEIRSVTTPAEADTETARPTTSQATDLP